MYPVFGIRRVGPGCLAEIEGLIRPILVYMSQMGVAESGAKRIENLRLVDS